MNKKKLEKFKGFKFPEVKQIELQCDKCGDASGIFVIVKWAIYTCNKCAK
jgi:hypothetical protein